MNTKLVQVYFEGICSGTISFTSSTMSIVPGKSFGEILDAEGVAYPAQLLDAVKTRKLPEFGEAVRMYESPLVKALS